MRPRLLVLDADKASVNDLRAYFSRLGWYVEACLDGGAALRLASSDLPFDAVVSALHFTAERDALGLRIVAAARRRRPAAAVVLYTACADDADHRAALAHGADSVVSKAARLRVLHAEAVRAMNGR